MIIIHNQYLVLEGEKMLGNIEWKTEYSFAEIETIRVVENKLCIHFPIDYLNIAIKFQGGEPSSKTIVVNGNIIIFGFLLTFLAFDELDILDIYNSVRYTLPQNHFPFAIDEKGNMFCFDYSGGDVPIVVFAEKERGNTVTTSYIAQSFSDFVQMLQ
ncbi:SMI1/KNR4 family protein [Paenibacillus sp. 19GGS1-52]|uniref:SMI1/KNR4 family protein n=1 Tax=Paenibacillus sp. 19GGS1-52 TaxID=2758563 RepID=UPI001EFAB079|nr:SMI1/KNR4 family protein [Paenibacillus sp. 19GGS1-52]ULO07143.1 SMI1/KNR4 family protein [Paenibacillus sp. 19GGS1-52]